MIPVDKLLLKIVLMLFDQVIEVSRFSVYLTWYIKTARPYILKYLQEIFPYTEEKFCGWVINKLFKNQQRLLCS